MLRRRYIVNGKGGQIHYARTGQGARILLLHQTPRSWDEYREVMKLLDVDFDLIAMDLPGMGASDAGDEPARIEHYADAAALLINEIGGPVTVCGHHTGGVVAMELASNHPELIERLILSSTPWIDANERAQRRTKTPIDVVEHSITGRHLLSYWSQRAPYYPDDPDYLDRFLKDALMARDAGEGHLAVGAYFMEKAAPTINIPTLIIEHLADPFASKHTAAIRSAFPHATTRSIEKGGVALEATADEFAEIVRAWMTETSGQHAETKEDVQA